MDIATTTLSRPLEDASAQEILLWAAASFAGHIAVSSSFQTQSVPLLHMLATTAPQLPVLFLDTGYHFPETIAFRDRLVRKWSLNLEVLRAGDTSAEASPAGGPPLYVTNPDLCCDIHKVAPMRAAMGRYRALISGIRGDQSAVRAQAQIVETNREGRVRIHPLLDWTQADVERYAKAHDLPRHPLSERGYASIGCLPCTRPPVVATDLRSGRWGGTGKTECGLHTILRDLPEDPKR
jgi:phosphoadenosine phosphosulfate reductase